MLVPPIVIIPGQLAGVATVAVDDPNLIISTVVGYKGDLLSRRRPGRIIGQAQAMRTIQILMRRSAIDACVPAYGKTYEAGVETRNLFFHLVQRVIVEDGREPNLNWGRQTRINNSIFHKCPKSLISRIGITPQS